MTHASIVKEERDRLGITENFIRLSCGVEDTLDLLQDIYQALQKAVRVLTHCRSVVISFFHIGLADFLYHSIITSLPLSLPFSFIAQGAKPWAEPESSGVPCGPS